MEAVLAIVLQFASLAGVAAFLAALVNFGKFIGWVKDENAGAWTAGLNLAALVVLVVLHFIKPEIPVEWLDGQAAMAAQIALIILGYLGQLGVGKAVHGLLSGLRVPAIGFSYSRPKG